MIKGKYEGRMVRALVKDVWREDDGKTFALLSYRRCGHSIQEKVEVVEGELAQIVNGKEVPLKEVAPFDIVHYDGKTGRIVLDPEKTKKAANAIYDAVFRVR